MDDKQAEQVYGKPDSEVITLESKKCDHFFFRYNATDIRCAHCPNGWIDGGKFILEDGQIVGKTI